MPMARQSGLGYFTCCSVTARTLKWLKSISGWVWCVYGMEIGLSGAYCGWRLRDWPWCWCVYRKEVQQIFDRYIKNNVRRLKRDEAVEMLKTEFSFTDEQANCMFSTFDKDKNDVMSLWEFQQFYMCVGNRCVLQRTASRNPGTPRIVITPVCLLHPPGDIAIRRVCWGVCLCVFWFVKKCWGRISRKRLRYRLGYYGAPIGNGMWRIEWSRDRWFTWPVAGRQLLWCLTAFVICWWIRRCLDESQ